SMTCGYWALSSDGKVAIAEGKRVRIWMVHAATFCNGPTSSEDGAFLRYAAGTATHLDLVGSRCVAVPAAPVLDGGVRSMRKRIYDLACPIANALDVVGDRWTLLILRDLLLGRRRYREFQDSLPGIPPNLLTERLRLLEMEGVVERRIYSDSPLRAEYAVT